MWNVRGENRAKWIFTGVAVVLFLVFRFVVPLIYPFLVGAVLAAMLYPVIRFLHRKFHIGKGIGALIVLTLLALVVIAVFGLCGYGIVEKGYEIFCDYEKYMKVMEQRADLCCDWIETRLHLQKGYLMQEVKGVMTRMADGWQETMIPDVFEGSMSGLKKLFSAGAFLVFTFLSAVLIIKEWDEQRGGIFFECKKYLEKVLDFLKIFLGAQIRIIGVIALVCLVGFFLAGMKGAFGLALLTACMDVLPFIGTGIIIVPLLLWRVVNAQYYQAFLLLVTYICCMIAREYLEPKFISEKTGVSPVLTLLGIYVGIRILGFPGIVLGPLYVLMLHIFYVELVENNVSEADAERE